METKIRLLRLREDQTIAFKEEMQEAFQHGFESYYKEDNQWQVLPDKDFYQSLEAEGAEAYEAIDVDGIDLEDYGPHQEEAEKYYDDRVNFWALGSQHWSKTPHVYGYKAYFGILLDMVGGANPNFPKEYYSQGYAAWVSNKVWRRAADLGYRAQFTNELGTMISDDHIPMNEIAGIPTIDIIDLHPESSNECFPEVWHTLNDNLENIDKTTLGIVGDVLLHVVYEE